MLLQTTKTDFEATLTMLVCEASKEFIVGREIKTRIFGSVSVYYVGNVVVGIESKKGYFLKEV